MEICKIDGCHRELKYKALGVCQTHYHRMWRNGSFDDPPARRGRDRYEDDRGYQFVYTTCHPLLAKGQMYIGEHRAILYEKLKGAQEMLCDLCSCKLTWKTCQADHIDENPRNNDPDNIRPLCRRCNTWRSMPPAHVRMKRATAITYDGETKTPHEWSKDPRVKVSGTTIRRRKAEGMTDEEALFSDKKTHNGRVYVDKRVRTTQHAYQRSNSLPITIDGETKTASEWSRFPGAFTDGAIRSRIRRGMSHKDAVFGVDGRMKKR